MGTNKIWFLLLFLGLFACAAAGEENALDQALLARLTGEGCKALSRLEEYFEGRHIQWHQAADDGRLPYDGHYYPGRDGFKMQLKFGDEDTSQRYEDVTSRLNLYLRNSDYYFDVSKKPDDSAWKIDHCVPLDRFDPSDYHTGDYYTILPVTIWDQSLARMIKRGEMTITGIRTSDDSPEEAVVFEFTHNREYPPIELVSGTLTLLPKKCWVISNGNLLYERDGYSFRNVFSFEYGENDDYPFFDYKKMTVSLIFGDDESAPPRVTWTYDIKQIDRQTVPSKELRLSFYGLPEPDFVRSVHRSRRLLFIVGSALIITALVMIFGKRRASKSRDTAKVDGETSVHERL
ncbi:MAG: hypothetical protein IKE64_06345 [Thermoguttaceae bacterium]|nr:hypothetical protein [Thermoguttaceae bacterium]